MLVLGGNNHVLTPVYDWIHDCIWYWHPGLEPEVGSSLEYKYSETQSQSGGYIHVKWWNGRPVLRA